MCSTLTSYAPTHRSFSPSFRHVQITWEDSLQAQESLSAAEAAQRARRELKAEEDKAKATLVRRDDEVHGNQSYVYLNSLEDTVK